MAFMTHTIASSSSLTERTLASVAQVLAAAATRHAKRRVYRTTLDELSSLSNRDLADVGLHRSNLRRIAMETAKAYTGR